MKKRTITQKVSSGVFGNLIGKLMLFVMLLSLSFGVEAGTQSFPFPQNYKYSYGTRPTNSDATVIQARYTEWKAKYYVESGTQARIKFLQPGEDGTATVSEGIAYGMLIMVYMDNSTNLTQSCFDKLFTYYKSSLDANGLMNWKMSAFSGTVIDANAAPDADIDVAQALMMADKQWGSTGTINYLSEAKSLIGKIWTYETQAYSAGQLLKPGDMFTAVLNPSYFITNAFTLFGTVTTNDWAGLKANTYALMKKCANTSTGLVPDWVYPDGTLVKSGSSLGDACSSVANSEGIGCSKFESYFLYDAIRVPWRMAQAYAWYGDADAKTIAGAIAKWASGKYSSDPSAAVDGYKLDGTAPGLSTTGFNTKGSYSNACFTGGLGISAMVDATYQTYLNNTWTKASIAEGTNGQYFTSTTQLLYLLCMTGNMPNFCDMNPAPVAAYNNTTGGCNTVYVQFNKPMSSTSVAASTAGWTVTKDNANTPIPITVNSATLGSDGKTVTLALAGSTDEPIIFVSYSGTPTLSSSDGKTVVAFSKDTVKDVLACARPYAVSAATNIYGDTLRIQFSKAMLASSLTLANFSVTVKGIAVTPTSVLLDASDATIVLLKIPSGTVTANTDAITFTYTPGTLKSQDGGTVKTISAMNVINNFLSETCANIETFDVLSNTWTTWAPGTMSTTTTDPTGTSKVGLFTKGIASDNTYVAVKGDLPKVTTSDSTLNARMATNYILKMRVRVSKAGAIVRVRLQDRYLGGNAYSTAISNSVTIAAANTWTDVALNYSSQLPSSTHLNEIQLDLEPDTKTTTAETVYFDDVRICPAPATTGIVRGYTTYDGSQVKIQYNTAMAAPTDFSGFTLYAGTTAKTITSVAIDAVDKKILVFTVSSPFVASDVVTASYSGTAARGLNGLPLVAYTSQPIINLTNRAIANGWRDDFDISMTVDPSDVTSNIGGDKLYTRTETITSPGTYSVKASASTAAATVGDYNSWGPTVAVATSNEVWDVTADPVVRFSASVPTGSVVWVRADMVDLVNARSTDAVPAIKLTADGAYHTYAIDFTGKFVNQYGGAGAGPVDKTNIVAVNLYQWNGTTSAVSSPPKLFTTSTVTYDWLSVGTTTKIYGEPAEGSNVNMGATTTAKSTAVGYIYIVPGANGSIPNTPRLLKALQDSVTAGSGLKISVATKDVAVTIATTGLKAGYYIMYAVNSATGEVSRKSHGINLIDITPPIITQASSGDYAPGDPVTVTVNEDAKVYLVPVGTAGTASAVLAANKLSAAQAVAAATTQLVTLPTTLTLGTSYVFWAIDYAGNISTTSSTPVIRIIDAVAPIISNNTTGDVNATTGIINATSNETGTIYLVKESDIVNIKNQTTLTTYAVTSVAVTAATAASIPAPSALGTYVLYAVDASGNVSLPTAVITVISGCPTAISIAPVPQDIQIGALSTLTTTITGTLGTSSVVWATSDATIASITGTNTSGTATGASIGSATITASITCNSTTVSGTATINVVKTPVTSISVTSSNPVSIVVGNTAQITAYVLPTTATYKTVSYTPSAPAIAIVDASGLITAKAVGTCTITVASTDDATITKVIPVNVTALKVSSLSMTLPTVTVSMGSTTTSTVVFNPTAATDKSLTVTSSSPSVTGTYDATTNVLTIKGVSVITGAILTVTSPDGPSTTVTVNVTCPTTTPTTTNVPNVVTCSSAPAPLAATFTSTTATAVWYSAQTGGTALATGNSYAHGKTSGVTTYYVAQTDNGCESSRLPVTLTINANPVPIITAPTAAQAFCNSNTTATTLAATPTAGTFMIDGITQTKLNPSTLAPGSHTVLYSVVASGCTGTASTSFTIDAAPTITIAALPTAVCSNASPVTLSATPAGGVWSGTAVTGSSFNPASTSAGVNTATYTVISGSCTVSKDATITVNTVPAPSFSGLPTSVCKGSAALTLSTYVSIPNGSFTDDIGNVSGGTFTPTTVGKSTITYTVTSGGCSGTKTASITVNDVPTITITPLGTFCSNAGKQPLVATPANGTWSGSTAITGTQFDPSVVSAGSYTLSYAYTDATTSCSSTGTTTVVVNNAPVPTAANASINIGGTPAAIIATGTGVITWYKSDKVTPLATTASYTPTDPTTTNGTVYTYYISNKVNGCESDKVAVTLTVTSCTTPAPTNPSVITVCEGVPIPALTATGTSLKWYDADGLVSLASGSSYTTTVTSVGTHTFKVSQTLNGCEGTQATASVTIESKPAVLTIADVSVCQGSPAVALTATSKGDVTWFDNGNQVSTVASFTPTVTATGAYPYTVSQKVGNCTSDVATVTYTILAKPAAPTITNVSVCEGATPYQITASGTNIIWYDSKGQIATGATLKPTTITGASVNTYSATQTSGTCVSDKATGTLTVNALPSVTLTGVTALCSNASAVTLTATPQGGTFTGAGVSASGVFDPSSVSTGPNVVTYSYTDAFSCSNSKTLSITVNSSANPTATGSSCLVGATSIPAMTASGSGTIEWYSSATATTILATGNSYIPTISTATAVTTTFYVDNLSATGCTSGRVPVTVTISNCTTLAPTVTAATICQGDAAGTLQATGTGIIWYDASANLKVGTGATYTPTDKTAGTYTYYASQTSTCESPKTPTTYTINGLPSVSFPAVSALCSSDPAITLSASPANGTFSGTGVSNGKFTPSQTIAGDNVVTYSYTDATTNCTAKASQTITVNYVAPPTVTPANNVTQVNVAPAVFTATGTDVKWYSDASLISNISSGLTFQAPTLSSTGTTTYYLTQTVNGCTSSASQAVLTVTSCATGLPTASDASSCVGGTIKAITASGTSLKWYSDVDLTKPVTVATPTSFVPTIDNTKASVINFYVTQNTGCEGPAKAVTYTVNALPNVTLDIVAAVCSSVTTSTALNGTPAGGVFSGDVTTSTFTPSVLGIGQHAVIYTYTNTSGCVNTASQTITINDCSAPKVTSISITPTLSVNVNATGTVSVLQLVPSGASTSVTWVVGNTDTATVAADGTVKGLKAGTTSIVAKATDGSGVVSNKCIVTVTAVVKPVQSVTFNNTSALTISETGTIDLSQYLVINPTDATIASITWSSLNTSVASVDATTGLVSGKAVSSDQAATIQVSVVGTDGKTTTATISVTVTKNVVLITSITIPSSLSIEEKGTATMAAPTLQPLTPTNSAVTWAISSGTGATIDPSTGVITVTGSVGSTFSVIAVAKDAGAKVSNECVVTIIPVAMKTLTFTQNAATCSSTGTLNLSQFIAFTPSNASDQNINWSIDDVNQQSMATVNLSTGLFKPSVSSGTVVVTAKSNGLTATITVTISAATIHVTGVTVTADVSSVSFNQHAQAATDQLTAAIAPSDATNSSVKWSLDKPVTGVLVDANGLVTFTDIQSSGSVTVVATSVDGGIVGKVTIPYTFKYKVDGVTISTLPVTINQNATLQLSAVESPTATQTGKPIVWSIKSSTSTGATISATTGVLIAGSTNGTITVVASVTDDDGMVYTSQVIITVQTVVNLKDITVNNGSSTLTLQQGDSKVISVDYVPANTGQTGVKYTTSDSSIVSVNEITGEIIGNKGGIAYITVTPSANIALAKTITVTVTELVSSISLRVGDVSMKVNNTTNLTVTVSEPTATNQTVTLSTSDNSVVAIYKNTNTEYILTAKGVGSATITALANDGSKQSASVVITVTKKDVESISVTAKSDSLAVGNSVTLVATVTPSDATITDVTWKSSDPTIATISSTGVITGVSEGDVTFTATANDNPLKSSTIQFTIISKPLDRTVLDSLEGVAFKLVYSIHDSTYTGKVDTVLYNNLTRKEIAAQKVLAKLDNGDLVTQAEIDQAADDLRKALADFNVGFENVEISDVVLYPNPVVDVLNVKGESVESVQIFDLNGKSVINTQSRTIDFSRLSSGHYEVIIKTKSNVSIQSVIKE